MNAVFLDTVGLIAIWDCDDQWHAQAEPVFKDLVNARRKMVTTSLVLFECGNAAARRPYRTDVDDLRRKLSARDRLIEPTPEDIAAAWDNYCSGTVGDAGIVDHVSFVVMRRLGITEAFTNDRHFQAAGFTTLF